MTEMGERNPLWDRNSEMELMKWPLTVAEDFSEDEEKLPVKHVSGRVVNLFFECKTFA